MYRKTLRSERESGRLFRAAEAGGVEDGGMRRSGVSGRQFFGLDVGLGLCLAESFEQPR